MMTVLDLNSSEALQFAGIAAITYLVTWWVIRPLSFVYRLSPGRISVRTFFLLPMASVKLSEISQVEVGRPSNGKHVRWLVSPYRRWSGQMIFAETERVWVALPDRFAGLIAEHNPAGDPLTQFRGDAGYQHLLAGLMVVNLAFRKLASCCVPLRGAAAWCMILLPLWLTWVEVVGSILCADDLRLPLSAVIGRSAWPHFAACAFLILCGITTRGLIAFGMPLPWQLAGISLFAAFSYLTHDFPGSHDILSHRLFDSCTGYSDRQGLIGMACIAAALVVTLAAWNPNRRQTQVASFFAATP